MFFEIIKQGTLPVILENWIELDVILFCFAIEIRSGSQKVKCVRMESDPLLPQEVTGSSIVVRIDFCYQIFSIGDSKNFPFVRV